MDDPGNFNFGLLLQKASEYIALGLCLAVVFYFGENYSQHPSALGLPSDGPTNILTAIETGLGVAGAMFLFSLYPVVAFVVLNVYRLLSKGKKAKHLPVISGGLALLYALAWTLLLKLPLAWPYWLVIGIVSSYAFASSWVLLRRLTAN